jgi:hypothetical protein
VLGKHLETNNETTAVALQQRSKYAPTTIFTVGNGVTQPAASQLQQLYYNNGNWGVFYSVLAKELS